MVRIMKFKNKMFFIVVLYNKKINESLTLNNIFQMNLENIEVVILDNSTTPLNDSNGLGEYVHYLNMNGNKGLSKPYNVALDYIFNDLKGTSNDYIVLFDDDTNITYEYFQKLNEEINCNTDVDIFAPIVYGQDGIIYSPNSYRYLKNQLFRNKNDLGGIKRFNAINSCLCVKASVYENYRYDENLFLDQVDTKFFNDMRLKNTNFKVLDTVIHQNFSQRGKKLNPKKMLIRYRIRFKDIMVYGQNNLKNSLLSFIKCIAISLQTGKHCKSFSFTLECFKLSFHLFLHNVKIVLKNKR